MNERVEENDVTSGALAAGALMIGTAALGFAGFHVGKGLLKGGKTLGKAGTSKVQSVAKDIARDKNLRQQDADLLKNLQKMTQEPSKKFDPNTSRRRQKQLNIVNERKNSTNNVALW